MSELSQSIQDDIRALEPGWVTTPVCCGLCGHGWVAVWPLDLDLVNLDNPASVQVGIDLGIPQLQCPQCYQQGHTQEVVEKEAS